MPLLAKKFHYFSTKGYSPFSKAEYGILIQNLLLRMGIAKMDCSLFIKICFELNGVNFLYI
jgi:hypothetical protein